jgi:hypothetical protein
MEGVYLCPKEMPVQSANGKSPIRKNLHITSMTLRLILTVPVNMTVGLEE